MVYLFPESKHNRVYSTVVLRPYEIAEYQLTRCSITDADWLPSVENEWSWMLVRKRRYKTHHQQTRPSLKTHQLVFYAKLICWPGGQVIAQRL